MSSSPRHRKAEEFDAAVLAADERMAQLWLDLRGLTQAASSASNGREAESFASADLDEVKIDKQIESQSLGARAAASTLEPPDRESPQGEQHDDDGNESDGLASRCWEELFGGGGCNDGSSESKDFEIPPQPRQLPVTQPSLRVPTSRYSTVNTDITRSSCHISCVGGSDTEVGTRMRAIDPGGSVDGVVVAALNAQRARGKTEPDSEKHISTTTVDACGLPLSQKSQVMMMMTPPGSRNIHNGAARSDKISQHLAPKVMTTTTNSVLREAIDNIISGGRQHMLRDGRSTTEGLEAMLEREQRVTLELREGVARLRAEQHRKAVDEVNARRRLAHKQWEEEEEIRFKAESARQLPPVPVTDIIFHRAVQTVVECRSESTQTIESGAVFIDAELFDGHSGVGGRGRQSGKKYPPQVPPWGGGGGRKQCDRETKKPKPGRESASTLQHSVVNPQWLLPEMAEEARRRRRRRREGRITNCMQSNVAERLFPLHPSQLLRNREGVVSTSNEVSRFEERCASALSRHLSSLDPKQRQMLMDDWGAADGGFEGAELCIRIEVTAVGSGLRSDDDNHGQQFVPVQPQPLRQLRLCLGSPASSSAGVFGKAGYMPLGWIKVDYDDFGHCQLPALCACVMYREKRGSSDEGGAETCERHFLHFSFRKLEHGRIFRRACLHIA